MIQTLFTENTFLFYTLTMIFGLIVGSFLNHLIYRLPLMIKAEWFEQCCDLLSQPMPEKKHMNLFFPPSQCNECKTQILSRHKIPLLSYIWLRGRCYNCRAPILLRYPLVELLTSLLFLAALWHYEPTVYFVFGMVFIAFLISIAFIDWEQHLLPDSLVLGFLWTGLLANTEIFYTLLPNAVRAAAGAWFLLWVFNKIYTLLTGKPGMRSGSIKLFAAFGAWFGAVNLPFIMIFSCFCQLIYLIVQKKPVKPTIPFGSFICLSGLLVLFFEETMLDFYMGLAFYFMYLIFH